MVKVKLNKRYFPDKYWLRYVNESGVTKQVNLSACANSFSLATGSAYDTGDGLRSVGWRYEADGCLCYELFCVGPLQLYLPLQPGLMDRVRYLLQGKHPQEGYREKLEAFEQALNRGGWKTVEKPHAV